MGPAMNIQTKVLLNRAMNETVRIDFQLGEKQPIFDHLLSQLFNPTTSSQISEKLFSKVSGSGRFFFLLSLRRKYEKKIKLCKFGGRKKFVKI